MINPLFARKICFGNITLETLLLKVGIPYKALGCLLRCET